MKDNDLGKFIENGNFDFETFRKEAAEAIKAGRPFFWQRWHSHSST